MPYTLKLDWTMSRIETVARCLSAHRDMREVVSYLRLYYSAEADASEGVTLKPEWPQPVIDAMVARLRDALMRISAEIEAARDNKGERSYEDLVADQAEVHAAVQEIWLYLDVTADAVAIYAAGDHVKAAEEGVRWAEAVREFSCPFCAAPRGELCHAMSEDMYGPPRKLTKPHENRLSLLTETSLARKNSFR